MYLSKISSFLLLWGLLGSLMASESLSLSDNWFFREVGTQNWIPARVPGGVHTDLLRAEKIEDPFYRDNEAKLQWIGEKDWEYENRFVPGAKLLDEKQVELVFEGLDTYADVYLNDSLILQANNMFHEWRIEVKPLLKRGTNRLRIVFHAPEKSAAEAWEALGYELPGGIRVMSRKAAFHYGWDWGPRFLTAGIWRPVSLQGWTDFKVRNIHFQQLKLDESEARLLAMIEIEASRPCQLSIAVEGEVLPNRKDQIIKPGKNIIQHHVNIKGTPKLWWSRGLGEPHLYELTMNFSQGKRLTASHTQKIGLRTIKLIRKADQLKAPGQDTVAEGTESFYFELNGVPIFAKGANYIPQDIFQERVTEAQYRQLIKNTTDANMNMLRIWGGGIYEDDIFYDLCDENGILVWQDFMFACAMYPSDSSFMASVEKEAIYNIKRLRHHPCIALWCGNNENREGWHRWGWQSRFNEQQKAAVWNGYQTLFDKMLPRLVKENHADIDYWGSSPSYGRGNPKHQFMGDSHYWGVWHDAEPFEVLNDKVPRFMSEFGFQSFPEPKTVASYALPEDMALTSEVMMAHQKHPRGNQLIATYMERDFNEPGSFKDFLYLSQLLQAEGMQLGLEAHRRSQPYCMGTLYWQLNDCWPVASWSGLDNEGNWKAMHYRVRDVFAPLSIFPKIEEGKLEIWIASDKKEDISQADLQVEVWDTKGKMKEVMRTPVQIPALSSKLYVAYDIASLLQGKENKQFVVIKLMQEGKLLADRNYYFVPQKDIKWAKAQIQLEVKKLEEGYWLYLQTDRPARAVRLTHPEKGHFSDNWFDLMPGEGKSLIFETESEIEDFKNKLEIRCLNELK
jgi:beta-mannosidase